MLINKEVLSAMLEEVSLIWQENTELLGDIDSRFGDGDHGVTMNKIAKLIQQKLGSWKDESMADFIQEIGVGILGINGGSAGPLYGTLVEGLGKPLGEEDEIDTPLLKEMLISSYNGLCEITKARCGEKTMMDAVIPAIEAAQKIEGDSLAVLGAAADAARQGADATKGMVSKFGRARSYGEKTLGTEDAGATSTALFFQGLYQGAVKKTMRQREE